MGKIDYIKDFAQWSETFAFFVPVKVRFSDTDAYGHLNNTKVFVFLEEARIELLKHLQLFDVTNQSETMIVVSDLQCNYIKEVFFDEIIRVYCKVAHVGQTSLDLHYMGKNKQNDVVFTARGRLVQLSKTSKQSLPWSNELKQRLMNTNVQ